MSGAPTTFAKWMKMGYKQIELFPAAERVCVHAPCRWRNGTEALGMRKPARDDSHWGVRAGHDDTEGVTRSCGVRSARDIVS